MIEKIGEVDPVAVFADHSEDAISHQRTCLKCINDFTTPVLKVDVQQIIVGRTFIPTDEHSPILKNSPIHLAFASQLHSIS